MIDIRFKVGDKVRIKRGLVHFKDYGDRTWFDKFLGVDYTEFVGQDTVIDKKDDTVRNPIYKLRIDKGERWFSEEMLEPASIAAHNDGAESHAAIRAAMPINDDNDEANATNPLYSGINLRVGDEVFLMKDLEHRTYIGGVYAGLAQVIYAEDVGRGTVTKIHGGGLSFYLSNINILWSIEMVNTITRKSSGGGGVLYVQNILRSNKIRQQQSSTANSNETTKNIEPQKGDKTMGQIENLLERWESLNETAAAKQYKQAQVAAKADDETLGRIEPLIRQINAHVSDATKGEVQCFVPPISDYANKFIEQVLSATTLDKMRIATDAYNTRRKERFALANDVEVLCALYEDEPDKQFEILRARGIVNDKWEIVVTE